MIKHPQNEYLPESVTPAGETLLEVLSTRALSQAELATRMGRPVKTINEIVKGKTTIMPETALQLEKVLGVPAAFWMNREQRYQEYLARLKERDAAQDQPSWPKSFPVKEMISMGWIADVAKPVELLHELFAFFGVASIQAWEDTWSNIHIKYRRSLKVDGEISAMRAWLRKGELEAALVETKPYLESLFKEKLNDARKLTNEPPASFVSKLKEYCSEAGVAVVFTPELPKSPVCGATRWLSKDKALIQLSLRYKTNDHLWFTFFHEAGHILLHGKKEVFVEMDDVASHDLEEEASQFAVQQLIPRSEWETFLNSGPISRGKVLSFSQQINIAAGIIVGQLQHNRKIPYNYLNDLKKRFIWSNKKSD